MARRTRGQDLHTAKQAKNPKALMRGRAQGPRSTGVSSNNEDNRPLKRDENSQTRNVQLMEIMEQADTEWDK